MEAKMNPEVTVLMSVYNGESMVSDAINSILNQSFQDFEFLIIDDGSTDKSFEIIDAFSRRDTRIRCIKNNNNLGLIQSLNLGISEAKGKFVARIDADDMAYPNRLELQLDYLNHYSDLVLCGTGFNTIDGAQNKVTYYTENHSDIKFKFLTDCHICHGAVMWNNRMFKSENLQFDKAFQHAEDYDLFARVMQTHKVGNLQEITMDIRKHETNVSKTYENIQQSNSLIIRQRMFKLLGLEISVEQLNLFAALNYQAYESLVDHGVAIRSLIEDMITANKERQYFNDNYLNHRLSDMWFHYCYNTKQKRLFKTSSLSKQAGVVNRFKMMLKG